ncbi:copper homeostasis protein cutC homolog isoform X1 [Pyrgilauda ruficollis]|uniref:copper homeostasis protein cutC homolog isoform X1 n=1 Tax=Pyrgilauda ruficollis TaxID=221976 RepID=UPI001B85B73F|nr:copper homeostasis protein cutC homolog isoform X1 [Pyrgilauda ruficollis]
MGSSWRCAWTRWSPPSTRSAEVPGGSSCAPASWKEGPPRAWVSRARRWAAFPVGVPRRPPPRSAPAAARPAALSRPVPPAGLLQVVKQCVRVPVFVMIRPRGGDFLYSDREVEVMKADIRLAKLHGADGLVFGALTEDGRIDTELCTALLAVCRPLPVTFHRAFDMVHDPLVALETLISLGFERVLTSGCDSSALEGLSLIKRLAEQAKGRIVVVPGGGITERNLQRILEGSTASEFHCSARSARDSGMKFRNPNVAMGASFSAPEYSIKVADVAKVRTLNAIAKNIL